VKTNKRNISVTFPDSGAQLLGKDATAISDNIFSAHDSIAVFAVELLPPAAPVTPLATLGCRG
jgi:hypothetical protein